MTQDAVNADFAKVNARFVDAFARGDEREVASVYTPDARLLAPGADTTTGREAIAGFWRAAMDSGIRRVELQTVEMVEAGDTAYEVGRGQLTIATDDEATSQQTIKYVVVWQRGHDGWHWDIDIWNEAP